jgi:hypothetical protein
MAKIIDIPTSGSIGNQTNSRNRSGQYKRQRSMPTQPRTTAQVAVRARLSNLASAWRSLTDNQRAAWAAFANSFTVVNSLGVSGNLTGCQCFIKVNAVNGQNGDTVVLTPPALPAFVAVLVTALTATAGTPLIELTGTSPATGTKYMVFASPQVSAGVSFQSDFRYIATFTVATTGKFALTTPYSAKFGAPVAGKKIFVRVVQSQAGMQDNGTPFTCIVGA